MPLTPTSPPTSLPEELAAALPMTSVGVTLLVAAGAAVAAVAACGVLAWVVRRLGRRRPVLADMARRGRRPLRLLLVLLAVRTALEVSTAPASWRPPTLRVLDLALIGVGAWLVAVLAFVVQDVVLARQRVDVADNRRARRLRTQAIVVRRVIVAVVAVVAAGSMLMTVPGAQAAGASVLASAGVLSVVAGLAAQTSLSNVFAGLQLAFTDALRVDDVVVVEGEWGNVEDITMTYVVVRVWDERRLILPSTYFTSTPFQNWTRTSSQLLGSVEADVDWAVPVEALRAHLGAFVERHPLWDSRAFVLQVTDATGSFVRLRALVSAADGPTLFDLRCAVREELVRWLRESAPQALPRVRLDPADP
ncbi:mechanosensitive ion channel family protein, partial [Kineococcus glutinatus]|uniref:mechanosensitive ion channel family protein n=1 Tax=Kineococcus glutinatus TaxID=1070872 RepID=UPI0031E8C4B0